MTLTPSEIVALAAAEGVLLLPRGDTAIDLKPKGRASEALIFALREQKAGVLEALKAQDRGPPQPSEPTPLPVLAPPNTTPTPDVFYDWIAPTLSEGELRVMLYLIRRTFGFGKHSDRVSFSQFCDGITTLEGKRLDLGTGMTRRAVLSVVSALETKGLVICHRGGKGKHGHAINEYSLVLKPHEST